MTDRLRIGVYGPHLGGNQGWVVSQGEVLVDLLSRAGHRVRQASTKPARLPRAVDTAVTVLRHRRSIDVAIVEIFSGPSFAMAEMTIALARAASTPVVVWLHGGNLPTFARRHRRRVATLLRSADRAVAPSPFLARELAHLRPDICVVPNALPLDRYPARTRAVADPSLLWMRTFEDVYRPELALEVLAALHVTHPDARLTLAGQDRGLLDTVKKRAGDLGLAHAVAFPGFLDSQAKLRALSDHDVFLSTNAVDNTPVSLLEAAVSGMAIVAMAAGGVGDMIVDGETGLLVPDGDVNAMAGAVRRLLCQPGLAQQVSDRAQDLGERSTHERVLSAWEELLGTVSRAGPSAMRQRGKWTSRHREERSAQTPVIRELSHEDLRDVSEIQVAAFPESAMTQLGRGTVHRYYDWLLTGPHSVCALAAEGDGELVGFLIGGRFRGAMTGFLQRNLLYVIVQVLRRPRLWRTTRIREQTRLAVGLLRSALRSQRSSSPGTPHSQLSPPRDFGVLAVAVAPDARRAGVGRALLSAAEVAARSSGAVRMHLSVAPSNDGAVRFYEKLGWYRTGEPWTGSMAYDLDEQ